MNEGRTGALEHESVGGHALAEVLDAVPFLYGRQSQIATIAELDASVESAKEVRASSLLGGICGWSFGAQRDSSGP